MTNDILDRLAVPPPPPSELDELISRDPLELSAQDIDKIIAYQRQQRARREAGEKVPRGRKKAADTGETVTLDLTKLGLIKTQPAPAPTSVPGVVQSFRRRL